MVEIIISTSIVVVKEDVHMLIGVVLCIKDVSEVILVVTIVCLSIVLSLVEIIPVMVLLDVLVLVIMLKTNQIVVEISFPDDHNICVP